MARQKKAKAKAPIVPPKVPPAPDQWPSRRVETWPIERPRDNPRNVRVHPDAQIDQIEALFRQFGQTRRILVNEDGTIAAGHATRAAMRRAGATEIDVCIAPQWSPEAVREYMLADNQAALNAEWSDDLGIELADVSKLPSVDMRRIGFSDAQFKRHVAKASGESTHARSRAASPDPVAEPGDRWSLGAHTLAVVDLDEVADVAQLFADDAAPLVVLVAAVDADVVISRWQIASGTNAVLTGENRDFATVGGERREARRAAAAAAA